MKSQLKAGALLSYAALFINSVISILYTPIMLNLLGQSEYGLYSLASSVAAYVGVLNFGLGNAVIRYTAKYRALNDEEGCSRIYGMFFLMYGVLGTVALILGAFLTMNSNLLFSNAMSIEEVSKLKYLMGIMVINTSVGIGLGIFSVIVLAHEKFIFQKVIAIIGSIITPLVMIPLLLMGYKSLSVAIVSTLMSFTIIMANAYYCFRVLRIKIIFKKVEKGLFKEVIIFSSFIFLNLIIEKIYWSTDQIILGIYSGTVAISVYTVGASFSGYFSGFSAAISNVFLSKVTGMVTKEVSDKEISELFIRIGRIQFIVISFALAGFIAFGQEFINLWVGKDYKDSFFIALLILGPMMIPLIQTMGGIILQAKNKQKFKTIVYLVIAFVNIILSILFVRWWGPIGCALGTAIAFTIGNIIIMNIYYWKKINIDIPKFWRNILRMSVPFILSLIFGITLNQDMIADNWAMFFVKAILFSIVYNFAMWNTAMNEYEKSLFIQPCKKIIRRFRLKDGVA